MAWASTVQQDTYTGAYESLVDATQQDPDDFDLIDGF